VARKGTIVLHRELCKGCYLCVRACPVKVLEPDTETNRQGVYPARVAEPTRVADQEKCIACGNCYEVCPDVCIEVFDKEL